LSYRLLMISIGGDEKNTTIKSQVTLEDGKGSGEAETHEEEHRPKPPGAFRCFGQATPPQR